MEVRSVDDVKVAVFVPRLDAHTTGEAEDALNGLIEVGAQKLLCDFSKTEYISSAGLRLLIATAKKLEKSGGKLVLCCLQTYVRDVFEMAGLTRIFTIRDSEEEALKAFA